MEEVSTRSAFHKDETTTISEYFRDSITSGNPPAIQECREFLEKHPLQRDAKQVSDKVRNLIGRHTSKRTVLPVELPHPQEKLMTNVTVLQRGGGQGNSLLLSYCLHAIEYLFCNIFPKFDIKVFAVKTG